MSPQGRRLRDVMTREVKTIPPTALVDEAASLMKSLNIGAIPVCNGQRLEGIVTDRDIVLRVVAEKRDPRTTTVQDAMTAQTVYGYEDQDVEDAAKVMQQKQIRRLPVVDRDKQLVGIVSLGDLAVKAGAYDIGGETLEQVSKPVEAQR
jgi:CBS domain-containing protein